MSNLLMKVYFKTGSEKEPCLNLESTGFLGYTGMQHRLSLPENDAMLFNFTEEADHAFWMKNVRIPLDIIFIDRHGFIAHIHENAQPMSTTPIISGAMVCQVIEANGGWCKRNSIRVGTKIRYSLT